MEANSSAAQFGRSLRLLVVDDDELGRSMMDIMLSPHGYKLDFACDGSEALQAIKTVQYDLVFMDLILPDLDGREVCRQVRAWEAGKRHVPIVALTAYDLPGQPLELVKAGMDDYIFKPYDLRGLTRVIQLYAADGERADGDHSDAGQPPSAPVGVVLDIQTSLADFANDVGGYAEILSDFIASLPVRLDKLRQADAAGDMERLGRECHSLKGIAAGLGAARLSRLASQLGRTCSDGQRASAPDLLRQVEQGMADVRAEAEIFLGSLPGLQGNS